MMDNVIGIHNYKNEVIGELSIPVFTDFIFARILLPQIRL